LIELRIVLICVARRFANEALEKQKKEFQSWGVLANWENCYRTFDKQYIIDQIRLFWKLYHKVRISPRIMMLEVFFLLFRVFFIDNINQLIGRLQFKRL